MEKLAYCFLEPPGYFLKKEVSIQFRGIFVFVFYSDPLHEFSHTFVHDQVQNHIHQALAKTLAGHRRACDIHLCPVSNTGGMSPIVDILGWTFKKRRQ